ncbi:hypothetical protein AGABI2DRAFT_182515 [Agaricus bisporus var. bisporus H97]|uniref:hypothetical protein n=1 Tax=Agaricus bisporus var. bisporus (strain H97 / ATCC MYA-4626 / FGSC 10389) TaxID=936046 RepID=UPI00029F57D3|nr:hypothetical protein AGABI2DRAFT_182515 [Agaricus bisporus var. bisporus H97]EKV51564.1 hypothetical protein AGABI2DRAFT_182515 [Agaricus bisporus var. bisporus H97]
MSTVQRKQAPRLPRPAARYWKGKAPKGVAEVESDDSDEELEQQQEDGDVLIKDAGDIDVEGAEEDNEGMQLSGVRADLKKGSMNITLKDVSVSKEGNVIVAGRLESGKTEMEIEESSEESEEEEEAAVKEESEEESSEYESDSEDEAPKPLFRPVFVPKRARATIAEKEALAEESEEVQKKREQEAEERRKQSHDMVAESIRRELAEKEKEDEVPDIDDTDGLDPTGEFEAWRLRELGRIKKQKEEELLREQEREEIERRRALPEEQRLKEDTEKAEKSRAEKSKGQQKFLQKYWHKGAFHQDEEILKRHDFTEATESTVDVSLLPKVMQVRNFGKRSRTKYTHLLDQDTTAGTGGFGGNAPVKHGGTGTDSGGCFLCGGPHLKKAAFRNSCPSLPCRPRFMPRRVKVAVVGSGLAGLTSAWLLTRPLNNRDVEFDVHLFEKADTFGMDAASMSILDSSAQEQWRIDVPMRTFQGGYYPQLLAMYKKVGVKLRPSNFDYSFSLFSPPSTKKKRKITTTFIYNGSSGRSGLSMPSYLADMSLQVKALFLNSFLRKMWTYVVFLSMTMEILFCFIMSAVHAAPFLRPHDLEDKSFGKWAEDVKPTNAVARWIGLDVAWQNYVRDVMVPLWSGMCTATAQDILNYPAVEFLDFIWLTIGTPHYVLANGVRDIATELSKELEHIHLSSPITSVAADPDAPHLASLTCMTASGEETIISGFHHIIFATEADTAASILRGFASSISDSAHLEGGAFSDHLQQQVEVLNKFKYRTVVVVNHTDNTLLPDDIRDRRELNLVYHHGGEPGIFVEGPDRDSSVCVPSSYAMVTHILPRPDDYSPNLPTIYQTTNPYIPPKKDSILCSSKLRRAIPTVEARKALQGFCQEDGRRWWECPAVCKTKLGPLQGAGRLLDRSHPGIWICGSYAFPGIPFLEGCVVSAKNVVIQGIFECEKTNLKEEPWMA